MNNLTRQPLFFLGANSPAGFVSHFADNFSALEGWHTYIIKGGPGTGKSTLMKRVADRFLSMGLSAHLCPCASDTGSLDAVIFPDVKIMLLDGTAPHTVEPKYIGACEEIINLCDCWDSEKLQNRREEIINYSNLNATFHRRAAAYISAAGYVIADSANTASDFVNREKAALFGTKLAKKHIKKTNCAGKERLRYLSAVTPHGHVFYRNTLSKLCDEIIPVADEYGAAAPLILGAVRDFALAAGHEIITCACPLSPVFKPEHIIIPALSLGFTTANRYHSTESETRAIHARRFSDVTNLHKQKHAFSYNKKACAQLLNMASVMLCDAKSAHDKLEQCYISAMDFGALDKVTNSAIQSILKRI